jgi:large subunit ribosomal protein L7/L12
MAEENQKAESNDQKVEEAVEESKESAEEAKEAAEEAEESAEKAEEAAEKAEEKAEQAEEVAEEAESTAKEATKTVEEVKEEAKTETESKTEVKVSGKLADIIKEIEKLTVLELADLVHALEDKFGVSATAPVAVAAGGTAAPSGAEAGPEETQTTFNVILADSGANKISVLKAIRELVPTLGLKEAKDLVDSPPKPILQGVNKESANEAKTKLEAAGAKVELQ